MIIILDGPDGSGKTTLAKAMIDRYGERCKYLHITRRKQQLLWYYASLKNAWLWNQEGYHVVIDRSWTSECIYSKVYHPKQRPQYDHLVRMIHRISLSIKALNVLCIPSEWDNEEYAKLCKGRDEMYIDKMEEVYTLYHNLYYGQNMWRNYLDTLGDSYVDQLSKAGVIGQEDFTVYDRYHSDENDISDIIIKGLELQAGYGGVKMVPAFDLDVSEFPHRFARYSGNPVEGGYLFLGNPRSEFRRSIWPMVSTDNIEDNTVVFINKCLHKMRILEYQTCFLNFTKHRHFAETGGDGGGIADFIKKARTTIVLGCEESAKYLHEKSLPYTYLPMPKETDTHEDYCSLITDAIR